MRNYRHYQARAVLGAINMATGGAIVAAGAVKRADGACGGSSHSDQDSGMQSDKFTCSNVRETRQSGVQQLADQPTRYEYR